MENVYWQVFVSLHSFFLDYRHFFFLWNVELVMKASLLSLFCATSFNLRSLISRDIMVWGFFPHCIFGKRSLLWQMCKDNHSSFPSHFSSGMMPLPHTFWTVQTSHYVDCLKNANFIIIRNREAVKMTGSMTVNWLIFKIPVIMDNFSGQKV